MKIDVQTFEGLDRPCYIVEERLLRRNLELISRVASEAGVVAEKKLQDDLGESPQSFADMANLLN